MRFKEFLLEEDGMGTAEVVIIAAVLVAIALVFQKHIVEFVNDILARGLDKTKVKF